MKRSCYFARVCDVEFTKKHIVVNLFSLQFRVREYMLKILCENAQNLSQDVGGYFLKIKNFLWLFHG